MSEGEPPVFDGEEWHKRYMQARAAADETAAKLKQVVENCNRWREKSTAQATELERLRAALNGLKPAVSPMVVNRIREILSY